jgi:hypothetical protein
MFIFNLNVVFTTNFLKIGLIRVRFTPGFPPGAGFHGEEFAPAENGTRRGNWGVSKFLRHFTHSDGRLTAVIVHVISLFVY